MKHFLRKHNALLATSLSLVLVMGGSLQSVQQRLADHGQSMQVLDSAPFSPLKWVLSALEKHNRTSSPRER